MPNEYGSRPCCRLINTALARGARPARLRRTAAAHRVPARHRSRTRLCGGVLGARRRQLAPHRNKAAARCRPNASLCCHLRSLLVLIDTIGATSLPKSPKHHLTPPRPPPLALKPQTGGRLKAKRPRPLLQVTQLRHIQYSCLCASHSQEELFTLITLRIRERTCRRSRGRNNPQRPGQDLSKVFKVPGPKNLTHCFSLGLSHLRTNLL
ncbi:Hypothetical predicted protein [Xyrichtys novacula]|uniref:Uncharacterized protein n=1 Tax=Xyrichtys novacula TaxID=13765 RepID=A0AAV1FEL2_XYRNO|nr:Hypothetical predicted protein [Xyrichtys novacula]